MRNALVLVTIVGLFALGGCKKTLEHPESVDRVYQDIQRDAAQELKAFQDKQKEVVKAKKAFEEAPIRTGQRQNAQDEYFELVKQAQSMSEKYRYLALKIELRKKYDQKAYAKALESNSPWPDADSYAEYETDKRLRNSPRQWNPEDRMKKRSPAAASSASSEEDHE